MVLLSHRFYKQLSKSFAFLFFSKRMTIFDLEIFILKNQTLNSHWLFLMHGIPQGPVLDPV